MTLKLIEDMFEFVLGVFAGFIAMGAGLLVAGVHRECNDDEEEPD